MPDTTPAPVIAELGKVSALFKAHERLLIVVLGAILIWFSYGKIENIIAAHDKKVYDADKAQLTAQVQANQALAVQLSKNQEQLQQLATQAAQQNAALEQANATLVSALAKQQSTDKTLPPPALAQRVETLASLPPGSVTPVAGQNFTVTNPALGQIAATLEEVPALQNELANTQKERDNDANVIAKGTDDLKQSNQLIGGLNVQIAEADKTCKAEIKVEVDKVKASRRKWFIAGFVVGVATRFAKYL